MIRIKTYANLFEAEFAVRILEQHGVEAHLSSDEVGGPVPSSFATGGVRLFVDDSDVDRAVEILTTPQSTQSGASDGTAASSKDEIVEAILHGGLPSKRVRSGITWLVAGLIVTVGCYLLAAPGGTFVVTTGVIFYGLFKIFDGVREAGLALHEQKKGNVPEDDVSG